MYFDIKQLQADYEKDGYLLLHEFIDAEFLEQLNSTTMGYLKRAENEDLVGDQFDIIELEHGTKGLRRIADPERVNRVYKVAVCYHPLIELVKHLLGGTVRFDHAKLNNKPPYEGGRIQWHQDFAFYPQTNDDMLAVGIMIDDCSRENGAMMVVPGSHKLPLLNHHQNGNFVGGVAASELNGIAESAVYLEGKAGTVTIHHARTLHASTTNRTANQRPFLVMNYFAVDAFPIFFSYDWDEFNSRILVGEATSSPRYRPVDCKMPLPTKVIDEENGYLTASLFDLQEDMEEVLVN